MCVTGTTLGQTKFDAITKDFAAKASENIKNISNKHTTIFNHIRQFPSYDSIKHITMGKNSQVIDGTQGFIQIYFQ